MSASKTILLVDDDAEILSAMKTIVEQRGYRVLTAGDGNTGLSVAEQAKPDLVIVDMMMPRKSGFLVIEKLKSRPAGPRVIMITANEGSRHKAYAELLGVDDYIRKPFTMERLMDAIDGLLNTEN